MLTGRSLEAPGPGPERAGSRRSRAADQDAVGRRRRARCGPGDSVARADARGPSDGSERCE